MLLCENEYILCIEGIPINTIKQLVYTSIVATSYYIILNTS